MARRDSAVRRTGDQEAAHSVLLLGARGSTVTGEVRELLFGRPVVSAHTRPFGIGGSVGCAKIPDASFFTV